MGVSGCAGGVEAASDVGSGGGAEVSFDRQPADIRRTATIGTIATRRIAKNLSKMLEDD